MDKTPHNYFEESYDLLKKYTDDRLLLLKIQTAKNTSRIISQLIFVFIASILLFFILMFLGFLLAYYFSEKMHSTFYGFSMVAGIYCLLLILFIFTYKIFFSKRIKNMVTMIFFEKTTTDFYDEDEEI